MRDAGRSRRPGGLWPVLVLAVLVAGSLVLMEFLERSRRSIPAAKMSHRPAPRRQAARSVPSASPRDRSPGGQEGDWVPSGEAPARVAIIIDDVGFDSGPVLELARLALPMTFAILPHQRYSRSLAKALHASGHEVILHLPMEPIAYPARDPGEGAIGQSMRPGDIAAAVRRDLDGIPEAVGVNNHMGSRATSDPAVMRAVLGVVGQRGLYFLDSRTTPDTVGFDMAREMGIPAVQRSVFLDDRREASYIEGQVRELLRKAREQGSAVAIGHPDPATVQVLRRSVGLFRNEAVRVVPASELAEDGGGSS